MAASRWGQGTPAGLPFGRPGIGEEIEGAVQHAAQPGLQSMRLQVSGGIVTAEPHTMA